jgi:hypothetical protein
MGRDARSFITGPDGAKLTLEDLPKPQTARWVPRKKAAVVAAVRCGLLSFSEAQQRYALTLEEFASWQDAIDHFGLKGLRATRAQEYRQVASHPDRD